MDLSADDQRWLCIHKNDQNIVNIACPLKVSTYEYLTYIGPKIM